MCAIEQDLNPQLPIARGSRPGGRSMRGRRARRRTQCGQCYQKDRGTAPAWEDGCEHGCERPPTRVTKQSGCQPRPQHRPNASRDPSRQYVRRPVDAKINSRQPDQENQQRSNRPDGNPRAAPVRPPSNESRERQIRNRGKHRVAAGKTRIRDQDRVGNQFRSRPIETLLENVHQRVTGCGAHRQLERLCGRDDRAQARSRPSRLPGTRSSCRPMQ